MRHLIDSYDADVENVKRYTMRRVIVSIAVVVTMPREMLTGRWIVDNLRGQYMKATVPSVRVTLVRRYKQIRINKIWKYQIHASSKEREKIVVNEARSPNIEYQIEKIKCNLVT